MLMNHNLHLAFYLQTDVFLYIYHFSYTDIFSHFVENSITDSVSNLKKKKNLKSQRTFPFYLRNHLDNSVCLITPFSSSSTLCISASVNPPLHLHLWAATVFFL